MLESHYAPRKALSLLPRSLEELSDEELQLRLGRGPVGVLLQKGALQPRRARLGALGIEAELRSLSERGDLAEAAQNLFALLRELDASPAEKLFAEPCSERRGLGHAIADRLARGAH
jgi:hypothetical protein